ncbi:MAG: hypothetical protein ABIT05_02240 [Chitinophagaceae bacterium]
MSKSNKKVPDKNVAGAKPGKPGSKGKTASEIMSSHISDKNHIITDEEFKELNLDTEAPGNKSGEATIISRKHNRPKDEDKDPETLTPWDVLK